MCADFRGATVIKISEMRRLELVDQAAQYQLAELAVAGNTSRGRRHNDLRSAVVTLAERLRLMRRSRSLTRPIDFEPTTETA
jgi:hypothetical protein